MFYEKDSFFVLLIIASLPVFAQGFYFDAGAGYGVRYGNYGLRNERDEVVLGFGFGPYWGLRAGYGPLGTVPMYVVADFATIPAPFWGAGIIFYPVRPFQLGASVGVVYGFFSLDSGFGWDISAAFDWGKKNHGCLIGFQYSGCTFGEQAWGIFVKYAYRKKVPQQTVAAATENRKTVREQPPGQTPSNTGIDDAIVRASQKLINRLPERTRLAVLSISSNNGEASAYAVEELEYQLVSSGKFTIVDRNTLLAIFSEQSFQMSGDVSDESALSIGQMSGAEIVITGSISGTGTNQRLSIRALDVRTAEIVTMVREEF